MAALGSQSIASSYEQLLHVDRDGGGNTTTHVSIKDGDNGTTFGFTIASDALMMTSTNRLEFGDTGTYIHQSADGVLDLVSDTEIELTATTIDMNGALDLSGNAQLSGTVTVGADGSGTDVIFYSGTAGDNFSWDASEEKLTITGTNGQTALDVADGNLVVADNVDIEGDIDVNGASNLDNTDIDGTLAVDGTTISLDATTSFNIDNSNTSNGITIGTATSGVPISIGHTTSETTVNDNLVVTGDIDLEGSIDVNGTSNLDAVDIDGAVQIDSTVTVGADDQGYDVIFYGDTASSNMTWDTSADDLILNDATLKIDQDDNVQAIYIDSESTTTNVIQIDAPTTTTANCLAIESANGLTTGSVARFTSNSSTTDTRDVVRIVNDHASATGATALKIQQDAAQYGMFIDQNGNAQAIQIDAENTTTAALQIEADALTTGRVANFYSNSSDTGTRDVVKIQNDHASATGATALKIVQDANQKALTIDSAATTNHVMRIDGPLTTTGTCLLIDDVDALTTGTIASFLSNSSTTDTRSLVNITNDNTAATGATGLHIQQDAAAKGMVIDQNGNNYAIKVDSEATTSNGVVIECDSLSTGSAAYIYSNSAEGSSRKLLQIQNDNDGSDDTICLFILQDSNMQGLRMDARESAYTDSMVFLNATARSQSNAFNFLMGYTDGDDDVQHKLKGDGVTQNRSGTFEAADYAEYFESKDGKVIAIGSTVKLDGDKIVACEDGDNPLGVIRPLNTSLVGNSAWANWGSKYLTDDYGSPIMEEYSVTEWMEDTDEVKTEAVEAKNAVLYAEGDEIPEGKKVGDVKEAAIEAEDAVYVHKDIQYQTDKIPSDVTVPSDARVTSKEKDGSKLMRKKLNPDYDESKTYVEREKRDEWHIVGLLGQIPITKGQPVADNWIKMKDVSNSVEMYFVK